MSFQSDRMVKATRKSHRCQWCGESILAGSSALYTAYIYEGDFHSGYYHLECHRPAAEYCRNNDGEFTPHEGVRGKPEIKEEYQ